MCRDSRYECSLLECQYQEGLPVLEEATLVS